MEPFRHADDTRASEPSVGEVARQAAEAIRTLNHLTQPAAGALSGPADAAELAAALASMTERLPQLLGQLSRWVAAEQRAGRLRVDALSPCPDPAAAADAVTRSLAQAAQHANSAAHVLDGAHQHLAHLAPRPRAARVIDRERSLDP